MYPIITDDRKTLATRFLVARVVAWLFLIVSILLLLAVYYKAEITFHGRFNNKYLKYYLISIFGFFFWSVTLWLKDAIRLNIVMVTTGLVAGIYLIEIGCKLMAPVDLNLAEAAKVAGVKFDTRTKYQVYQDLKNESVDAVFSIHPVSFNKTNGIPCEEALFPFGGISKKSTIFCNESGKYVIYMSDRFGFNNPDSEWDSTKTEWMLTGDSFTHGACVNPGEDISGQIRSITGSGVINLGYGGNDPLHELAALTEYAEFKKPKKMLWIYYEGNDLFDLAFNQSTQSPSSILMSYLQPEFSQKLINKQTLIDNRLRKYIVEEEAKKLLKDSSLKEFHLLGIIEGLKTSVLSLYNFRQRIGFDYADYDVSDEVNPLFIKILSIARDRTAAWGGKLYFVYLPHFLRYASERTNHGLFRKRDAVIEVVRKLNIPIVDIHNEVFAKHSDPRTLYPFSMPSAHYNAEGYSLIAKAIISGVKSDQK
jgi:hypothetical protein